MPPVGSPHLPENASLLRLALASDIHFAGPIEQARGEDTDLLRIPNPIQRTALRCWRHFFWMRHPLGNNSLLPTFLHQAQDHGCTHAVINGDYAADTASLGLSDPGTFESASLCLDLLHQAFPNRLRLVLGDHELGKLSFFGHYGGLRLESWHRATRDLQIQPLWTWNIGAYRLIAVTSTLVALPLFARDILPAEQADWEMLRAEHLNAISRAFEQTDARQRILLFCHDPSALPFLETLPAVRQRLLQLELTVIGHLHSEWILWKSRVLAGMPRIPWLGSSIERMSAALRNARTWQRFRVRLCPSLAGIQIERGGGWVLLELDPSGSTPCRWNRHRLQRPKTQHPGPSLTAF
jgi:hypothetical protein